MFKTIIALCLLILTDLTPSLARYNQLILIQHSPLISFFWEKVYRPDAKIDVSEFAAYLSERRIELDPGKWIVNGLWPVRNGEFLSFCKSSSGTPMTYDGNSMNSIMTQDLKKLWPSLRPSRTEEALWEAQYDMRGSCVSYYTAYYFQTAATLISEYNVGEILTKFNIFPGDSRPVGSIVNAITSVVGKNVYVKCFPHENTELQYLLEVQMCFSRANEPKNCQHNDERPGMLDCDPDKNVVFSILDFEMARFNSELYVERS